MSDYSCLANISRHIAGWREGERSNTELINHASVAMAELACLMVEVGKAVEKAEDKAAEDAKKATRYDWQNDTE